KQQKPPGFDPGRTAWNDVFDSSVDDCGEIDHVENPLIVTTHRQKQLSIKLGGPASLAVGRLFQDPYQPWLFCGNNGFNYKHKWSSRSRGSEKESNSLTPSGLLGTKFHPRRRRSGWHKTVKHSQRRHPPGFCSCLA